MTVYRDNIAILPFRATSTIDWEANPTSSNYHFKSSFVIKPSDIAPIPHTVRNIIDIQFLHGYLEPTLAILYESSPTWTGRLAVLKDTVSIAVLVLHLDEQKHAVIWTVDRLPYDSFRIVPLQEPTGSSMILTTNAIIYVEQAQHNFGIALNSFARETTDFRLEHATADTCVSLDGARHTFLTPLDMLIALRTGELYVAQLIVSGRSVDRIRFYFTDISAVIPSALATIRPGYVFLGSRVGDSLLVAYKDSTPFAGPEDGSRKRARRADGGKLPMPI